MSAAATAVAVASPSARTRSDSAFTLRFVGMMGFVQRSDGSFLVATPGNTAHAHLSHQPFLMARAGSRVAQALDMAPAHGVVPGAFDMRLADARPDGFVYRCLDNTSLDVVTGADPAVTNASTQMAQLDRIVPGSRVRGNIEQWATSRVSLRGGRIEDSSAHPDAGRVWSFGGYQQRLTDAVNFEAAAGAELRLTVGAEARTFTAGAGERRGTVGDQRGAGARSGQPDAAGAQRGGVRLPRGGHAVDRGVRRGARPRSAAHRTALLAPDQRCTRPRCRWTNLAAVQRALLHRR